jgi:RNA polymerase sigma-70 factor (ECF subfamily)
MQWLSLDDPLPNLALREDDPEPEDVTILREQSAAIQKLLAKLPPDYRAAVVLRYWYDYSYVEIADILDTTESAIKSRLFRARQMLADSIDAKSAPGLGKLLLENA